MSTIVYYAIPFFILTLLIEVQALRRRRDVAGYTLPDTGASLAMGVGNVLIAALAKTAVVPFYFWLHRFALFDIGPSVLATSCSSWPRTSVTTGSTGSITSRGCSGRPM